MTISSSIREAGRSDRASSSKEKFQDTSERSVCVQTGRQYRTWRGKGTAYSQCLIERYTYHDWGQLHFHLW